MNSRIDPTIWITYGWEIRCKSNNLVRRQLIPRKVSVHWGGERANRTHRLYSPNQEEWQLRE